MSESDAPKQVDDPDYHSENHTAVQTCGWTKNALRGGGARPWPDRSRVVGRDSRAPNRV